MILYRGPSALDGQTIVAIATLATSNRKTGDMVQTWILVEGESPLEASREGSDASVCGDCPHRWATGGGCYVNLGQAPNSVWKAYQRGIYDAPEHVERVVAALQRGTPLRIGSYGDPAAVPVGVWRDLLDIAGDGAKWTGYTHQWRHASPYQGFLMASVDTHEEAEEARANGWRYFRVGSGTGAIGEIECLAETRQLTCAECGLCNGTKNGARKTVGNIYINPHGALVGRVEAAVSEKARRSAALAVL